MDAIEQMCNHRSIRKYRQQKICPETLIEILDASKMASSSGNMQAYSIIVTTCKKLRKQLYKPHMSQSMVLEAPALVTFCADFRRMRKWLKLKNAPLNFDNPMSFFIGAIDAILVSQNLALAAEAKGLGICYLGSTLANCHQIGRILNCPKHVVPVVGFTMGYPAEMPELRQRLPTGSLIHFDKYHDQSDEDILSTYNERESSAWERYRKVPELWQQIQDSGVENLAQVYTKIKYSEESHLEYSKNVLDYLKKQGFGF